jgi:hypothetical protein
MGDLSRPNLFYSSYRIQPTFRLYWSRKSSVRTLPNLRDGHKDFDFDFDQGPVSFLLSTATRPTVRTTQPSIQKVPVILSMEVKWPRPEAQHVRHLTISKCGTRTTAGTPNTVYWYAVLIKTIEI